MAKIKEIVWDILVGAGRVFPFWLLQYGCRLVFERASRHPRADKGLVELYQLNDILRWYLDRVAIRYGAGVHPKHRLTGYHQFFIDRIGREVRVLDVGCGNGAVAYSLAQAGALVTGVDFNKKSIDFAQNHHRHENLTFKVADIITDPPDGYFDVVVMSNVLEHIEQRVELLKLLLANHRPQRLLIRVPMKNRHWDVPLKKELGLFHYSDPTHCTEYTLDSFTEEIEEAGLVLGQANICWGEIWAEVHARG